MLYEVITMPASAASMMASTAEGGGTKRMLALAPVASTAVRTVSNTGTPHASMTRIEESIKGVIELSSILREVRLILS